MRVSFQEMYNEFLRVLLKAGFSKDRGELCAKLITENSCDGVYSHGLNMFANVMYNIDADNIDIDAEPVKAESFGVCESWDGRSGPGNLNAYFCMDRAIELAGQKGLGCVALRNTNHWLRGGTYGLQAAERNCIGICWTNTISNLPAWGAKDCRVGNNPLVMAVPRAEGHILLDMAMSQFSYGKIKLYELLGQNLPLDGGYDIKGVLTKEPKKILASGRPLPIGHWKGSGLALILDLIAAILSAGKCTCQIDKSRHGGCMSQVFIAIDISAMESDIYIEQTIEHLHASQPISEGGKVYYPGERMLKKRKENLEKGIPVVDAYWQELLAM